jgi:alpha-tubulin suppressor-like RCC1 family protein
MPVPGVISQKGVDPTTVEMVLSLAEDTRGSCVWGSGMPLFCGGRDTGFRFGVGPATVCSDMTLACSFAGDVGTTIGASQVKSATIGDGFLCVLPAQSPLPFCLGSNADGIVGGMPDSANHPLANDAGFPSGKMFSGVTGRYRHVCALAADGSVVCWGNSRFGAAGAFGTESCAGEAIQDCTPPVTVPSFSASQVSSGADFDVAIAAGSMGVFAWGLNDTGQLGHAPGTERDIVRENEFCTETPAAVELMP